MNVVMGDGEWIEYEWCKNNIGWENIWWGKCNTNLYQIKKFLIEI